MCVNRGHQWPLYFCVFPHNNTKRKRFFFSIVVRKCDTNSIEFMFVFVFFNKSSCKGLFSLASGSVHIVVVWHSAELWRVRGVTEWVHNASECFLLTYWQLFSWKTSPKERESDPTERNCPAGGTSWDTVNGTWERELKLVQHGDVWMEYQICVIDISKATERWNNHTSLVWGTEI